MAIFLCPQELTSSQLSLLQMTPKNSKNPRMPHLKADKTDRQTDSILISYMNSLASRAQKFNS